MSLRRLIIGGTIFTAGVLASNTVRHGIAALRADERVPKVRVHYATDGVFVNGNKVYQDRVGEPRCDWNEIEPVLRKNYALRELEQNKQVLFEYVRDAPTADQRQTAYISLLQLARKAGTSVATEVDSMRTAIGYRWDLRYGQMGR